MIIWINGAFGAGKTQAAYELQRRLPDSYVYDPEHAGYFIRENLPPSIGIDDFQDYPMWRAINRDLLDYISARYSGDLIVPMTITSRAYYDEIIGSLSRKYEVCHIILCAERRTILGRLASRLENEQSWAALQIDRCIRAFDEEITGQKLHTDHLNIYEVVEQVAALAGVTLTEDRRSGLRRLLERTITKVKHIR